MKTLEDRFAKSSLVSTSSTPVVAVGGALTEEGARTLQAQWEEMAATGGGAVPRGALHQEKAKPMGDPDYRIGKLSLAPGDTLVVKVDHPLSEQMAAAIRSHLNPHLPEGVKALILGREIDLAVLTKADIDARTGG